MKRSLLWVAVGLSCVGPCAFAQAGGFGYGVASGSSSGSSAGASSGGHGSAPAAVSAPSASHGGGGNAPSAVVTHSVPVVRSVPSSPSAPYAPAYGHSTGPTGSPYVRPEGPPSGYVHRPGVSGEPYMRRGGTNYPYLDGGAGDLQQNSEPIENGRAVAPPVALGAPVGPARVPSRPMAGGGLGRMPAVEHYLERKGDALPHWRASRQQALDQSREQNISRINQFQQSQRNAWTGLQSHPGDRVRMARERGPDWNAYVSNLWGYRYNRAAQIRYGLGDSCDGLFTHDWWQTALGYPWHGGYHSPWWWWGHCSWNTAAAFCGYGWNAPLYYDYGSNIILDSDTPDAYIDGESVGPRTAYEQQGAELANPPTPVEQPSPPDSPGAPGEWLPLGVFALTQQEKGDAVMFLQISMSRTGLISGGFTNVLGGDAQPIAGSIDKQTQRTAWHIGNNTETIFESSIANLTRDVSPVIIHHGTQAPQTWLLVRIDSPDAAPQSGATPGTAPSVPRPAPSPATVPEEKQSPEAN